MGKEKVVKFVNFSDKENLQKVLVQLRSSNTSEETVATKQQDESKVESGLASLNVSDSKSCSLCSTSFADISEQRQHYKLDWHRYNLKQRLQNKQVITEEAFEKLAEKSLNVFEKSSSNNDDNDDDAISLSGSEFSSEEEDEGSLSENNMSEQEEVQRQRHPKFFFANRDDQILSYFKVVTPGYIDKCSDMSDSDFLSYATSLSSPNFSYKWAVLMLGGGHFAGAIFDGAKAVVHKTFHCYTVRAKQGGSQSSADNRSGTSHPKSAGASLRRYNQAALQDHVKKILTEWKVHFNNCDVIFFRAVSGNRNVIFGDGLLDKNDRRLRTIPFPTRRATFGEVKRVQQILSTVEIHSTNPVDESKVRRSPVKSVPGSKKLSNIRRSKSRDSPKRPLPKIVQDLAGSLGADASAQDASDLSWQQNVECSTNHLDEFENSAPPPSSRRGKGRKLKKKVDDVPGEVDVDDAVVSGDDDEVVEVDEDGANLQKLKNNLVTACKVGDSKLLSQCLDQLDEESINMELSKERWTALHIAAQSGKKQIVNLLLEHGADPTKRNRLKQVPYTLCPDKETRNTFRRFQAENPEKFDYAAALIPVSTPLTAEEEARLAAKKAEKRKAQRLAKKEKEKAVKALEDERKKEEEERQRFLNLTDREKRALAAERRILEAAGSVATTQRCYQCGVDITGLVPFTYLEFRFCKPACVKEHRQKCGKK